MTDTSGPAAPGRPGERSDAELMRAHADGSGDAFGELMARHQARLWSVAVGVLRDPDDAADAVQEAFLSAYRTAARWRGEAAVTTWLHRIVVNACLDRRRRDKARPVQELAQDGPLEPADPRDDVAAAEARVLVRAGLAHLSADHRAALTLVDLYGYAVAEAAEILDVAPGTVKSRCARARLQLAVVLGHLSPDLPGNREGTDRVSGAGPPEQPAPADPASASGPAEEAR